MCMAFAALHPVRAWALVLRGTGPGFVSGPDWPWGWTEEAAGVCRTSEFFSTSRHRAIVIDDARLSTNHMSVSVSCCIAVCTDWPLDLCVVA
jgi:hypothetical protein